MKNFFRQHLSEPELEIKDDYTAARSSDTLVAQTVSRQHQLD